MKAPKKKLDRLFQIAIKERDEVCQVCQNTQGLNAHHIYSRARMNTRWDLDNGILLCVGHHTFSSLLSAHKAPRAFFKWLEDKKGKEWVNRLEQRSQMVAKGIDYMAVELYLKQNIKDKWIK